MNNQCVLVANEPRAYRETLAAVLHRLRPHLEVISVEPDGLDGAVLALAPGVVVCSQLTPTVERVVPVWVALYPEGQREAVVDIAHKRTTVDDLGLAGILGLIDHAQQACT